MKIKKYDNVNTNKLISILNNIFKLNFDKFNELYGTDIMETDYEDIEDFAVVKNSKTDNRLDYVEIELKRFTATIFSDNGIERIYNEKGYPKLGRRAWEEIRILTFLKFILEKCR